MTEKGKTGKTEKGTPEAAVRALAAWGPERAREAEAVCRLLPIGFPYQYPGLPLSVQKVCFLAGFLTRFTLFKLLERLRNATGAGLHRPFRPPFCLPACSTSSFLSYIHQACPTCCTRQWSCSSRRTRPSPTRPSSPRTATTRAS